MSYGGVKLKSSVYGYPIFPTPVSEDTVHSPGFVSRIFTKNHLTADTQINFRKFCCVSLTFGSFFPLVPCNFGYSSSVICIKFWIYNEFCFVIFIEHVLNIGHLACFYLFLIPFVILLLGFILITCFHGGCSLSLLLV